MIKLVIKYLYLYLLMATRNKEFLLTRVKVVSDNFWIMLILNVGQYTFLYFLSDLVCQQPLSLSLSISLFFSLSLSLSFSLFLFLSLSIYLSLSFSLYISLSLFFHISPYAFWKYGSSIIVNGSLGRNRRLIENSSPSLHATNAKTKHAECEPDWFWDGIIFCFTIIH